MKYKTINPITLFPAQVDLVAQARLILTPGTLLTLFKIAVLIVVVFVIFA